MNNQPPGTLLAEKDNDVYELKYQKLILATGARELFLPFPGWTSTERYLELVVSGVGKTGLPIEGRKVCRCCSGPLLLAVADYLKRSGANVLCMLNRHLEHVSRVLGLV
jgi:NADPH-dependent 2,4-dienoyl-CoA reductase/sulfur reductase-like enzyme